MTIQGEDEGKDSKDVKRGCGWRGCLNVDVGWRCIYNVLCRFDSI